MSITWVEDYKQVIDDIRNAIGRDITINVPTISACSLCTLDPTTNLSTDPFCIACEGAYWIETVSGYSVNAHVTWGKVDELGWVSGGQLAEGDCKVQIEYTDTNKNVVDISDIFIVDDKEMAKKNIIYRGVPSINRIIINLEERKKDV